MGILLAIVVVLTSVSKYTVFYVIKHVLKLPCNKNIRYFKTNIDVST